MRLIIILINIFLFSIGAMAQTVERFASTNKRQDLTSKTIVNDIICNSEGVTYILTKTNDVYTVSSSAAFPSTVLDGSFKYVLEKLLVDREGIIWGISRSGHLLNINDPISKNNKFRVIPTSDFKVIAVSLDDLHLNILTEEYGLYRFKLNAGKITRYVEHRFIPYPKEKKKRLLPIKEKTEVKKENMILPSNLIHVMVSDNHNNLWFGSDDGLFNLKNGDNPIKFDKPVTSVLPSKDGLYVATEGKIWYVVTNYFGEITHREVVLENNSTQIRKMAKDNFDNLWMIGDNIIKYNLITDTLIVFDSNSDPSFKSKTASSIAIDKKTGRVWIGTKGSGVYIVNNEENEIQTTNKPVIVSINTTPYSLPDYSSIPKSVPIPENYGQTQMKQNISNKQVGEKLRLEDEILVNFGEISRSKTLTFEPNQYGLTSQGQQIIDAYGSRLVELSFNKNNWELILNGHSSKNKRTKDYKISDKVNFQLSVNRALEVKKYLVNRGIDSSKIIVRGFGDRIPLPTQFNEEYKNQRVDIILRGKNEPTKIETENYFVTVHTDTDKAEFKNKRTRETENFYVRTNIEFTLSKGAFPILSKMETKQLEILIEKVQAIMQVHEIPNLFFYFTISNNLSQSYITAKKQAIKATLEKERIFIPIIFTVGDKI